MAHKVEQLEPAPGAIVPKLDHAEVTVAEGSEHYKPLRAIVSRRQDGSVLSRWTFTPEQRQRIANGADLFLEMITGHRYINPFKVQIGVDEDWDIAQLAHEYGYPVIAGGPLAHERVPVHVADEPGELQQRCVRCGLVLVDATGAVSLDGVPMRTFPVGGMIADYPNGPKVVVTQLELNFAFCSQAAKVN